jgi:CheY-like chemotaxis protein
MIPSASAGCLVLVVDDDADMRDVLASVLQELGLIVLEAQDGLEAIAVVHANPSLCLIISDLKMPRCDGLELARALKELPWPSPPPFVLISGYSDPALGRAEELNIKAILRKPFRLEEIHALVARWIRPRGLDDEGAAR